MVSNISKNWVAFQERFQNACDRAGRRSDEILVLVVTKNWGFEKVQEVLNLGHSIFGENRIQEAEEKISLLPSELDWHFIGRLQRNKVRRAVCLFSHIHSIDSLKLLDFVNRVAIEEGRCPKVLLQVNVASEKTKGGFEIDEIFSFCDSLGKYSGLNICGLMCIPPFSNQIEETRQYFSLLRDLRDKVSEKSGLSLPHLSMGMSSDFELAILEGASIIRLGSLIFGKREK